jgi:hypothetical protein
VKAKVDEELLRRLRVEFPRPIGSSTESRSPQVCLDDTLFWAVTDRLRLMCERKPVRFKATRDDMILVFVPKLEDAVVGIL